MYIVEGRKVVSDAFEEGLGSMGAMPFQEGPCG